MEKKYEKLSGLVERITFVNEENGFSVIKVRAKGFGELVTVVGSLSFVNVGSVVNMKGEWVNTAKFGMQFKVQSCSESIPATVVGIEKYLGSGLIKGIGPVYAKRIVKRFKEDTLRVIEEEPDKLLETEGIGEKRLEMVKQAWQEHKEIKNVMIFLQSYDVSTSYAVKIYRTYGDDSVRLVKENPYRLADDIWGIGFKTADGIAEKMGYDPDSYVRCRSGILFVLNQLSGEGHCYARREQLLQAALELLGVEEAILNNAVDRMIEEKSIISEIGEVLYLPALYHSEVGVARRITDICRAERGIRIEGVDGVIERVQKENAIKYDEVQIEAIKTAAESKFMVLTGGPGTGKTTTTLAIIKSFEKLSARILLAAPTGRAAKRFSEVTGMEAKTIHRLLEFKPPEGYLINAENQLKCDVLIVDETSMVDIILMYNLLKAVPDRAIVILVGDVDQLPSVGAGNVLRDIIESHSVNVVKLTRIFRQAMGSMIVTNAHRINEGMFPVLKGRKESDFFFIDQEEPEKVLETIKNLCIQRLPSYYGVDPIADIQVLAPMTRGGVGTRNLNVVLQEALNPEKKCLYHSGVMFKLNDKVMQIKNNYEKNVFNGDIGRIKSIDLEDRQVVIRFDGNDVEYDAGELDEVVLAYATTIHKSQGSEYGIVVVPLVTQHFMMLQRNLLYTCVTRAKKAIVIVGTKKALAIAVKNNKVKSRNSRLVERLKE